MKSIDTFIIEKIKITSKLSLPEDILNHFNHYYPPYQRDEEDEELLDAVRKWLKDNNATKVKYLTYDWSLEFIEAEWGKNWPVPLTDYIDMSKNKKEDKSINNSIFKGEINRFPKGYASSFYVDIYPKVIHGYNDDMDIYVLPDK